MATATSNPIRPYTGTYNSQALFSVTDFRTTCAAGSVVQLADEAGEQIAAIKSFDYIAQFTVGTEDPENAGLIDLNDGSIKFDASASLVINFLDLKGGAAISATGALSRITSVETNCARTSPGTATISGYTLLGASGDNPFVWA